MKILVIGSGGREHAITWRISQSTLCGKVYAAPGNPGIAQVAECIQPARPGPEGLLQVAEDVEADLTVVGPEAPLVAGVADAFQARGRRLVGPTAQAAQLEGSKVFAKEFLKRAGIPTARFEVAESAAEARNLLDGFGYPVVLKADALAAGKGVIIACDKGEAEAALERLPTGRFVIEEYLEGEEVSFIVLSDGRRAIPFAPTQDHKAVYDGDKGPNTGGMGAYFDHRILTEQEHRQIMDRIIMPTLEGMQAEGSPFTGFLYAGLMMTAEGPKVLEFNVRLGDPEAQPLLHGMQSDFVAALADGEPMRWPASPSVCVVLAAGGYPGKVTTGDVIHGIESCGATVFQAGTKLSERGLETAGGRVLGVTACGETLAQAIEETYRAVDRIHFEGMHYRRDIGRKGLKRW